MANRALQAKTLKLQKQRAALPYLYDTRIIVESDTPRTFRGVEAVRPKPERKLVEMDITCKGKGPSRTPIFNAANWEPETRLYRRGKLVH